MARNQESASSACWECPSTSQGPLKALDVEKYGERNHEVLFAFKERSVNKSGLATSELLSGKRCHQNRSALFHIHTTSNG